MLPTQEIQWFNITGALKQVASVTPPRIVKLAGSRLCEILLPLARGWANPISNVYTLCEF